MLFFLDHRHKAGSGKVEVRILETGELPFTEPGVLYLHAGAQRIKTLEGIGSTLILIGDPVFRDRPSLGALLCPAPGEISEPNLYEEVRGHYNWFLIRPDGLSCGSSFGAIYPVYYFSGGQRTVLCSSSVILAEAVQPKEKDRRNLLERLLFNYPFFDSTWWEGIRLLEAHRYLSLGAGPASIAGEFDLSRYFGAEVQGSRQSLRRLTELFQEEAELFFPDLPFGISFTGGFDGRTLVAAARRASRDFFTFSFGRPGASDLSVPMAQAGALGIPYWPITLGREYLEKDALESALSFMRLSEFNGNFGRPHYHFAAQQLSEKTEFIMTGNFGSELFRAMHEPGVMMTEHLIRLFSAGDDSWKEGLVQAAELSYPGLFGDELDSLVADLETYLAQRKDWDPNHRFYHFVFHELFRKYFGAEMVMQRHYLNNRTPFLSLRFFRELNRTRWAGIHSRLYEKQKARRMKGQVFYSSFIREAERELYYLKTSKGYSPADVLETWRLPLLAGKVFLHKRFAGVEPDSNSVDAFFRNQRARIREWIGSSADPLPEPNIQPRDMAEAIQWHSIAAGWEKAGISLQKPIAHESLR